MIIAEDGVTSLRYYVGITRDKAAAEPDAGPAPEPEGVPPGGKGGKGPAALEEPAPSPAAGPLASTLAAYSEDPALTSPQVLHLVPYCFTTDEWQNTMCHDTADVVAECLLCHLPSNS